jgi:hypothetical protein
MHGNAREDAVEVDVAEILGALHCWEVPVVLGLIAAWRSLSKQFGCTRPRGVEVQSSPGFDPRVWQALEHRIV